MKGDEERPRAARLLALVVAPLLISVGLSMLTDGFAVRGFAQADAIQGEWTQLACFEFYTWPDVPAHPADTGTGEYLAEEVASVTPSLVVDSSGSEEIQLLVAGAYPSYGSRCEVGYRVSGVSARLGQVAIEPGAGLSDCVSVPNGLDCQGLTVRFAAGTLKCVDPGEEVLNDLVLHVEQRAPQRAGLSFRVGLTPLQCGGTGGEEPPSAGPSGPVAAAAAEPPPSGGEAPVSEVKPSTLPRAGSGASSRWALSRAGVPLGLAALLAGVGLVAMPLALGRFGRRRRRGPAPEAGHRRRADREHLPPGHLAGGATTGGSALLLLAVLAFLALEPAVRRRRRR